MSKGPTETWNRKAKEYARCWWMFTSPRSETFVHFPEEFSYDRNDTQNFRPCLLPLKYLEFLPLPAFLSMDPTGQMLLESHCSRTPQYILQCLPSKITSAQEDFYKGLFLGLIFKTIHFCFAFVLNIVLYSIFQCTLKSRFQFFRLELRVKNPGMWICITFQNPFFLLICDLMGKMRWVPSY